MSKKVFEEEIGKTLRGLKLTYHKCPDVRQAFVDKVDFAVYAADESGKGFELECKETGAQATFSIKREVTANQKNRLERVNATGAVGLLLVNFGRQRGSTIPNPGVVAIYRWPFVTRQEQLWCRGGNDPWSMRYTNLSGLELAQVAIWDDGESLRLDQADVVLSQRGKGSVWPLAPWLSSSAWG
jgi:hypothetical protein